MSLLPRTLSTSSNPLIATAREALAKGAKDSVDRALADPVFIVSAPRSGGGLLFESLSSVPGVATIGGESHGVFAAFSQLRAENPALDSAALNARHADTETVAFYQALRCFPADQRFGRMVISATGLRQS